MLNYNSYSNENCNRNFILKYNAVQSNMNKFKMDKLSIVPQCKEMLVHRSNKMNYEKIYNQLIKRSREENRQKTKNNYYEEHHIIPKCIGGTNEKSNLVLFTAREHFVAHWILTRIYPNEPGIIFAFNSFCMKLGGATNQSGKLDTYSTSKNYEFARQKIIKLLTGKKRPKHISEGLKTTTYVNNGVNNKRIKVSELYNYLEDGWKKGRLNFKRKPKQNLKKYNYNPNPNYRCPEERRKRLAETKKNNPQGWISKNGQSKQIFVKDYPLYEKDGWILGVRFNKQDCTKGAHNCYINKGIYYFKVKQNELSSYIACGWIEIDTYTYLLNKKEEE